MKIMQQEIQTNKNDENLIEKKIDTLEEPPMFKVTDTHYAKTWLLHPSAPKIEKPEAIQNIHQKLIDAFNI